MGLYADQIFPRLMDWIMRGPRFQELRKRVLEPVSGLVLEIGFGTGLNLPHYPPKLTWLSAVEPGNFLPDRVAERTVHAAMPVEVLHERAECLPWDDGRFDYVVSTWTLCTIADVPTALREIQRVLKPTGRFVFLEHGLSDDPKIAKWQARLNPLQRILACGCNLNRPIDRLIRDAGFSFEELHRFVMEDVPRIGGEMYRGIAVPSRRT